MQRVAVFRAAQCLAADEVDDGVELLESVGLDAQRVLTCLAWVSPSPRLQRVMRDTGPHFEKRLLDILESLSSIHVALPHTKFQVMLLSFAIFQRS